MKKIWVSIVLIFLAIFIFEIAKTYSYYIDEYNNKVDYNIASWKVVVNDKDITSEEDKEFIIDNYNYIKSDNSTLSKANDKFAPGMIAEFTITIDSAKVDVAFDYYLDIDLSVLENDNIKIAYVNNSFGNIEKNDNIYHGFFDKQSIEKNEKDLITVGIEWFDTKNSNDYEFSQVYEGKLSIPVNLSLKQKME